MSLHPADETPLAAGMTFHVHPNLIFDDFGLYITESMVVTDQGGLPFTTLPRELVVRD
jgi:ectoine hydrolase